MFRYFLKFEMLLSCYSHVAAIRYETRTETKFLNPITVFVQCYIAIF